jgi:Uma2 family endonuclease
MATVLTRRRSSKRIPRAPDLTADGLYLHIPQSAFTLAGFREWVKSDELPEKLRVTFIRGEIYLDMSKEELESHAKVKAETCRVLLNLNYELDLGDLYLDGVLVTNKLAGVSNNPDGILVSYEALESGRVRAVASKREEGQFVELLGTPDWLMEIVSGSSIHKDTVQLRSAYHRARIPEFWLIDARGEEIDFKILLWRASGYVAAPKRDGWQRSRVFGREFRLERRRTRLGTWKYTLHVR